MGAGRPGAAQKGDSGLVQEVGSCGSKGWILESSNQEDLLQMDGAWNVRDREESGVWNEIPTSVLMKNMMNTK